MGCDIHFNVEKQDASGKWRSATPKNLYIGRNYLLFGYLAGVRSNVDPKFPPRGFPTDASAKVQANYKKWAGDAHTASYLTLEELIEISKLEINYPVYLHPGDYKKYKNGESSISFYTEKYKSTVEVSNEEMERRINLLCFDDESDIVTVVNNLTIIELLPNFSKVVSSMKKLSANYNKVRSVFWFDN